MTDEGDVRDAEGVKPTGNSSETVSAVTALMEQRRRYEGWIAALDARRESTPAHVFERVHTDYASRLHAVVQELSQHADELRGELETLEGRLHLIDQDQQRAKDERAEGELRAHVGELSPGDWSTAMTASDDRLAELAMSRAEVEQELSGTRELLDEAQRPAVSAATADEASPPVDVMGSGDVEGSHVAQPSTLEALDASELAIVTDADVMPGLAAGGVEPMELSASVIAAEQQILDAEGEAAAPFGATVRSPGVQDASRFDELAFLSSVVDAPAGEIDPGPTDRPDETARRSSFAQEQVGDDAATRQDRPAGVTDASGGISGLERETDPPYASTSAGSGSPLKLTDAAAEGTKTLKCGECGSMNNPTEWYCERCGAELASL